MVSFETGTVIIAFVVLTTFLTFISFSLNKSSDNVRYPPVVADCPDYWLDHSEGDKKLCVNKHEELGNKDCSKTMDFSDSVWAGDMGFCKKKQWAKKCNLTWDGITNNDNACSVIMNIKN